ncbi:MAG: YceD family protein [Acutalibacteraceae bacterium]
MQVNLKDVFLTEGSKKELAYSFSMNDISLDGFYPFREPVMVKALFENHASLVEAVFDASFKYFRPCDRCCEDVEKTFNFSFTHRLVVSLEGDGNDEYIETPDFTLDIDELVISDIILSLPSRFLCSDDCKGICPNCGKNLNLGDCDCNNKYVDPRLEKLKELLD